MDDRLVLLALILEEIKIKHNKRDTSGIHSSIYILQRCGVTLPYSFSWEGKGLRSKKLAKDLRTLKRVHPEEEFALDERTSQILGILSNRYALETGTSQEINALATYLFQQMSLLPRPKIRQAMRGTFSLQENEGLLV